MTVIEANPGGFCRLSSTGVNKVSHHLVYCPAQFTISQGL